VSQLYAKAERQTGHWAAGYDGKHNIEKENDMQEWLK
jgi:hypothetical protein